MLDLLQKGLLTGLGVALITREKVMEATRNLVEEGKITADEAEELANDLLDEGRRQWKEMQGKITTAVRSGFETLDIGSHKDFRELQDRFDNLEKRFSVLEDRLPVVEGDEASGD
jgi:polyhydroxyalkanoate synthesis regulator phasin